ncbi:MAG: toxin-antitoxin system, toxin component, PIN family protein [Phycisphaerales bacterium]|nr:MAG: toxin-antitoxin system, toxin component, PIN family protein [Phycisphaerales bacterium]
MREGGHDATWIGELAEDPGDDEVLAMAVREGRILVTLDKDFGEMTVVRELPHCGIVRLVNISVRRQAAAILGVLQTYADSLGQGAIVTVEPGRVRLRPGRDEA